MAQDLGKVFEKEIDLNASLEKPNFNVEKNDQARESRPEKESNVLEKNGEADKEKEKSGEAVTFSSKTKVAIANPSSERQKQIDAILSEGLDEIFLSLNPAEQKKFIEEGKKTVFKINELLTQTKVKIKKIIEVIKIWLKLIPKVNRHFLEQEAKIKADKIIKLKK